MALKDPTETFTKIYEAVTNNTDFQHKLGQKVEFWNEREKLKVAFNLDLLSVMTHFWQKSHDRTTVTFKES